MYRTNTIQAADKDGCDYSISASKVTLSIVITDERAKNSSNQSCLDFEYRHVFDLWQTLGFWLDNSRLPNAQDEATEDKE